jgi:U11/U12 small nuclear ribonucleoprotein SNRNP25
VTNISFPVLLLLFFVEFSVMGESAEYKSGLKKEKVLKALLEDPILADVPKNPTLEDVETLIGLELGSAMRISVLKLDATSFHVILMNTATVKDLKLAIKNKINYMEQSSMGHRHISWLVCFLFVLQCFMFIFLQK